MNEERHEYLKSLIQVALWDEYVRTENKEYKELYEKWYNSFEKIDIRNIE